MGLFNGISNLVTDFFNPKPQEVLIDYYTEVDTRNPSVKNLEGNKNNNTRFTSNADEDDKRKGYDGERNTSVFHYPMPMPSDNFIYPSPNSTGRMIDGTNTPYLYFNPSLVNPNIDYQDSILNNGKEESYIGGGSMIIDEKQNYPSFAFVYPYIPMDNQVKVLRYHSSRRCC